MTFIHTLTKLFHPIMHIFTGSKRDVELRDTGTIILSPKFRGVSLPVIKFASDRIKECTVSEGMHVRTNDGKMSHITLRLVAMGYSAIYTRIIFQVRFRNPDTNEIIEIVDYQPKSSSSSESAQDGEPQAYGIQDNLITWDWKFELDPISTLPGLYTYCHDRRFKIWIKAASTVKAEFRMVAHFREDGKKKAVEISVPKGEGMFERLLELQDA